MSTNVDEQVQQAILDLLSQLQDDATSTTATAQQQPKYEPIIPSTLLDYHLTRAGIKPSSLPTSSKHLLSLVTEKYVTDVITDALAYSRLKQTNGSSSSSAGGGSSSGTVNKIGIEDLQAALADHGVTIKRPPYHL